MATVRLRLLVSSADMLALQLVVRRELGSARGLRAMIVFLRGDGWPVVRVSRELHVSRKAVWKWSRAYSRGGLASVLAPRRARRSPKEKWVTSERVKSLAQDVPDRVENHHRASLKLHGSVPVDRFVPRQAIDGGTSVQTDGVAEL